VRLECAECHNHPLENFTQDDFYGLSAFFARLRVKHGYGEYRRTWYLEETGELLHPVTKQPVAPKLLGAEAPAIGPGEDRREALARWITSPSNPYFARAAVNRVWHEFFDLGIVEPYDDFRSTNVPTNPQLLARLAGHFVEQGFRLKPLIRTILNSRTYQLASHDSGRPGGPTPLERKLFACYGPRRLPAEALLDSIGQVTGIPYAFQGYPPGTLAKDVYVPDGPDYFLVTFGIPRRDILAERQKSPTLSQALHLMNGATAAEGITAADNVIGSGLSSGASGDAVATEIFERAYARDPRPAEKEALASLLAASNSPDALRRALESVLWSILNSKEFQLNY
jgi:hypothetical protein